MSDLGYVVIDRNTLKAADEAALADSYSSVVRHATIETAADRARRLAGKRRLSNVLPMRSVSR